MPFSDEATGPVAAANKTFVGSAVQEHAGSEQVRRILRAVDIVRVEPIAPSAYDQAPYSLHQDALRLIVNMK